MKFKKKLNFFFFGRSKWHSNPHFRGSYSSHTLHSDALNASRDELAAPITNAQNKPILCFAGEATSRGHFSTVHGAIESGWRAAQSIIDAQSSQ